MPNGRGGACPTRWAMTTAVPGRGAVSSLATDGASPAPTKHRNPIWRTIMTTRTTITPQTTLTGDLGSLTPHQVAEICELVEARAYEDTFAALPAEFVERYDLQL